MTRTAHTILHLMLGLALVIGVASQTFAEDACCPATSGVTSGQVDVPVPGAVSGAEAVAVTDTAGQLPEGHPQLPQGHPEMPQGHPQVPAGHPQLPAGHPSMGTDPNAPTSALGTLIIKATQGTQDGPAVAGDKVVVELYTKAGPPTVKEVALDEHGVVMIENLEITGIMQPVVTVHHAGATFRSVGNPMSPAQADQMMRINVYEMTDEKPDLSIPMQHVMVRVLEDRVQVMHMVTVNNPSDHGYRGAAVGEAEEGKEPTRVALTLPLPAGAMDVNVRDGFDDCCTTVTDQGIVSGAPLMPGNTQMSFDYTVPAKDGKVNLTLRPGMAVGQLMVFLPEDGSKVTVEGLEKQPNMKSGMREVRVYSASPLGADQQASIKIQWSASEAHLEQTHPGDMPQPPANNVKLVAGVGVLAMAIAAVVMMLFKPKGTSGKGN